MAEVKHHKLVNIPGFFATKSIKLSDSFIVSIDGVVNFRCAGFTIPKTVEFNEEVHKFGNATHKMLIPKIDILPELQLELYEDYGVSKSGNTVLSTSDKMFWPCSDGGQHSSNSFIEYGRYSNQGYDMLKGQYFLDKTDIKRLDIFILSNDLRKTVYKYSFYDLVLTKYTQYDLSYSDESLCKWSLTYTFGKMVKGIDDQNAEKLGL